MENIEYKINSMDTDLSEKYVVCACSDALVRICTFNNETLMPVASLSGHQGQVTKAIYLSHGELIASSDFSGNLIIWKLEDSKYVKKAEKHVIDGGINDIAGRISDSTIEVFCACERGLVKTIIFDAEFNTTEKTKEIHKHATTCISCNSKFVVSGGVDFSVAFDDGQDIRYFKSHQSAVNSVAIAPSNSIEKTIFASCAEDGTLIIYQGKRNNIEEQIIKLKEPAHSLSWNKTGFVLTVGYGESSFKSYILGENGKEFVEVEMKQQKRE